MDRGLALGPEAPGGVSEPEATKASDFQGDGVDWLAKVGDDYRALVEAKGWSNGEEVLKSYRNLEGMLGRSRVSVPEAGAGAEEWERFYDTLGRPETPEEYGFQPPEDFPAELYDTERAERFAALAHRLGLTDDQARALHDAEVEAALERHAVVEGEIAARERAESEALQREWGRDFEAKLEAAGRAARALATETEIDALADAVGTGQLVKLFARLGEALGEDRLAGTHGDGAVGALDAKAEIDRLSLDTDFTAALRDRRAPGHRQALERWRGLHRQAYPGTWTAESGRSAG